MSVHGQASQIPYIVKHQRLNNDGLIGEQEDKQSNIIVISYRTGTAAVGKSTVSFIFVDVK